MFLITFVVINFSVSFMLGLVQTIMQWIVFYVFIYKTWQYFCRKKFLESLIFNKFNTYSSVAFWKHVPVSTYPWIFKYCANFKSKTFLVLFEFYWSLGMLSNSQIFFDQNYLFFSYYVFLFSPLVHLFLTDV